MMREELSGPQEGYWIEWKGGDCPVESDNFVATRHRNGLWFPSLAAGKWACDLRDGSNYWEHRDRGADIIAYRVLP